MALDFRPNLSPTTCIPSTLSLNNCVVQFSGPCHPYGRRDDLSDHRLDRPPETDRPHPVMVSPGQLPSDDAATAGSGRQRACAKGRGKGGKDRPERLRRIISAMKGGRGRSMGKSDFLFRRSDCGTFMQSWYARRGL